MIQLLALGAVLIILLALPALIIGRWTTLMVRHLENRKRPPKP